MRNEVTEAIIKEKLMIIVRGVEKENLIPLGEALCLGGVHVMEITFDSCASEEDNIKTGENIKMLAQHFKGRMFIGAGTVITPKQVEIAASAGGTFIVSPDTCKEVIEKTTELGLVSIPGAITPTEIMNANRFGADFVKLFPINTMGVDYVKQLKAPLEKVKMLAVGGIGMEDIERYAAVGICGFGIGGAIAGKQLIKEGKFDEITKNAKAFREKLNSF